MCAVAATVTYWLLIICAKLKVFETLALTSHQTISLGTIYRCIEVSRYFHTIRIAIHFARIEMLVIL